MQGGVGAKMGVLIQCRCMSRTSHTRVHPGRASPSGMTCLEKCVPMSLCNRQLASSNTIISFCTFIYNSIHFLKTLSHTHTHTPTHTHTHTSLSLSLSLSLSPYHSTCPYMFVAPRRQSGVANYILRRLADPLSILFLGHGDLARPWLQLGV